MPDENFEWTPPVKWIWSLLGAAALIVGITLFTVSWSVLEFTEFGLDYNGILRTINPVAYGPGRHFLGIGHSFIIFPSTVQTVQFSRQGIRSNDVPLRSRTKDGLEITLEISFQYQLKLDAIYDMYMLYGSGYQKVYQRIAMDLLTFSATQHPCKDFFANRTVIASNMEDALRNYFEKKERILIPLFQFQSVQLPGNSTKFERAISDTQVADQKIKRSQATQEMKRVEFETGVIQAQKNVEITLQQAAARKRTIELHNEAFISQYNQTYINAAEGFKKVRAAFQGDNEKFLQYLKIRAIRDHPSERSIVSLEPSTKKSPSSSPPGRRLQRRRKLENNPLTTQECCFQALQEQCSDTQWFTEGLNSKCGSM